MSEVMVRNNNLMTFDNLDTALQWGKMIAESSLCPQNFKNKPGDVLVAIQFGQELGLKPMQAIQNIAVIGGKPSLYGDAMLAVCKMHPDFEYIDETFDTGTMTATCKVKRRNQPEQVRSYSKERAEKAGLWGKAGPWRTDPERMLQMRARGFALRDVLPDALKGMYCYEEMVGVEERDITPKVSNVVEHINYREKLKELATDDEMNMIYGHYNVTSLEPLADEDIQQLYKRLNEKRRAA